MTKYLLSMPIELKEMLQKSATKKGLTLNGLILQILWDWIEN